MGPPREDESSLADDFFSWFFHEGKYLRVRRVGTDGKVRRFRGFAKPLMREFLSERARPQRRESPLEARSSDPAGTANETEIDREIDRAFCAHAVSDAMDGIRRAKRSYWDALVRACRGESLKDIGRMLRETGAGGSSIAAAHRHVAAAKAALRQRLARVQLARECATAEAGEALYAATVDGLAEALHAYVRHVTLEEDQPA